MKYTLSVTSAAGIEGITKNELFELGYGAVPCIDGHFDFSGTAADIVRTNMYLRTAERVFILIADGIADTFDSLFDLTASVRWQDYMPRDAAIVVNCSSVKSKLFAVSSCKSIVKKAIMTVLSKAYGLTTLPENGAEYRLEVKILNDKAKIYLDTSGQGLHKRGYRTLVGVAPIRETTAAAILKLADWSGDRALIDPFAGSGTIPIEAAMSAISIAPGISRRFAFEDWAHLVSPSLLTAERDIAESAIIRDKSLRITGYDIDKNAKNLADVHAKSAKVAEYIHFQRADMRTLSSRYSGGVIVTNPPYGERLMTPKQVAVLYKDFRQVFDTLDGWSLYLITACERFEEYFGRRADATRKLMNGGIRCRLYIYNKH